MWIDSALKARLNLLVLPGFISYRWIEARLQR
jgi:hypothetical protein